MRLQTHDYRSGWYFVTIVTEKRRPVLGRIFNQNFRPSLVGQCVAGELVQISERRPGCRLHEFVIMPDHLHAIIELRSSTKAGKPVGSAGMAGGLGTVICHFKRGCALALKARQIGPRGQLWQRGYHEWIIRSERHLAIFRRYVNNNVRAAVLKSRRRATSGRP